MINYTDYTINVKDVSGDLKTISFTVEVKSKADEIKIGNKFITIERRVAPEVELTLLKNTVITTAKRLIDESFVDYTGRIQIDELQEELRKITQIDA